MKKILKFLPLVTLLLFSACKKEEPNPDSLPPITQEGKNTFGCYINGEVWVPHAPGLFERNITPVFGDWIRIEALRYFNSDGSDSQDLVISFNPDPSNVEKLYSVENENASFIFLSKECEYHIENNITGSITITKYDLTEEKVIAGTFEFILGKEGCETLHFTDGRFDVKVP